VAISPLAQSARDLGDPVVQAFVGSNLTPRTFRRPPGHFIGFGAKTPLVMESSVSRLILGLRYWLSCDVDSSAKSVSEHSSVCT
jgi:hypothetical protein